MSVAQTVYDRSPRPLQHGAVSAVGLGLRVRRHGRGFRRALERAERVGRSPAATRELQQRRLAQLLDRWTGPDVANPSRDPVERLLEHPVTSKADVKADPERFHLEARSRVQMVSTGGSTGSPLRFRSSQHASDEQWAVWWRYRRWHGIDLDTWCGQFNARPICSQDEQERFWRYNVAGRQVVFSYAHLSPETAAAYVAEINRRRLRWLHGHPSTLGLLATHMDDQGLRFEHEMRWITFGCENVPGGVPDLIRTTTGVQVRQHYGLAEAVANFSECPQGRLHVDEDFAFVEFLPFEGHDDLRRVVGTALTQDAQAFVRYDTGDLVSGVEDGCDCGRPGRTVGRIDGRTASFAVMPDGVRIGPVNQVFRGLEGIVQGQVFVRSDGVLEYHVVPGPGYSPAVAEEVAARTRARSRGPIEVVVEPRTTLQRRPNGKVPVVIQGDPPR